MSVQGDPATTAFIERICEAHRERDPEGPLVTMLDGAWAYCAGHQQAEHDWRVIEPTARPVVEELIRGR
jgi:hypothetical protein